MTVRMTFELLRVATAFSLALCASAGASALLIWGLAAIA